MKIMLIIASLVTLVFLAGCPSKNDNVQVPATTTLPAIETSTTQVKSTKGVIQITGDFSPMCPALPGFRPLKAGDVCDIGFKACSSGTNYTCVENKGVWCAAFNADGTPMGRAIMPSPMPPASSFEKNSEWITNGCALSAHDFYSHVPGVASMQWDCKSECN